MSRSVTPARRSQTFDEDYDDLYDSETPRRASRKRQRLTDTTSQTIDYGDYGTEVDVDGSQSNHGPLLPDSYRRSPQASIETAGDTMRKHQPGSIVRVTLKNFVTYSRAEFFPGPNLNMVIGPNGSGKSSLVCAICIGLGWETKHLGRAKDVGEFIKRGSTKAMIEIELAADPAKQTTNPVITTRILKEKTEGKQRGKAEFFLDGQKISNRSIRSFAQSFAIQVDNLCQFLPQDRVVEFAALNSRDLLVHTQRAAAPEHMQDWYKELIRKGKMRGELTVEQKQKQESLSRDENRQRAQQADVDRWREENDLQHRIAALEKLRPLPRYVAAKDAYEKAKERKAEAKKELKKVQDQLGPNLRAISSKREYHEKIESVVELRKKLLNRHKRSMEAKDEEFKKCQVGIKRREEQRTKERQQLTDLTKTRTKLVNNIQSINLQMQDPPPEIDTASMNAEVREKTIKMRELDTQYLDAEERMRTLQAQAQRRDQEIASKDRHKQHLQSQVGRQSTKLQAKSPGAAKAWEWLQNNRSRFQGPVFGPPMIECNVKNERLTAALEAVIGPGTLTSFTATNQADFKTLQDAFFDELKLEHIDLRVSETTLDSQQPPVSDERLQEYGLDGWLLDLLDGPSEVLSMLCDDRGLHLVPYAASGLNSTQYNALTESDVINRFVDRQSFTTVNRRREYGSAAVSKRVQQIEAASFFTGLAVDRDQESSIDREIRELRSEVATIRQELEEVNAEMERINQENERYEAEKQAIVREKENKQKAKSLFDALPVQLEAEQAKYDTADEKIRELSNSTLPYEQEMDKKYLEKAQIAIDQAHSVEQLRTMLLQAVQDEILQIEAASDLQQLHQRHREDEQLLEQSKQKLELLTRSLDDLKAEANRLWSECNALAESTDDYTTELFEEVQQMSSDDLETEIESNKARLEMSTSGSANIIKEFEARAAQIETKQQHLNDLSQKLEAICSDIQKIRSQWEPELDAIIAEISSSFAENFASIHCAGEVGIHKDEEDFEQWSVEIRVKFRENEPLSLLDAQRQSGGERAVSTIFYLMAMQSLARAPFRVVDEINQGMDPRNERLVHSRLVQIACAATRQNGGGGSQYFLITPKLLNDLEYHENMKVHCIASGEWMPDDHNLLNLDELARKSVAMHMASA